MIAVPLCLAWTNPRKEPAMTFGVVPILAALFVGTLFSMPMIGRPQVAPIRRAGELIQTLAQAQSIPRQPIRIVIATDGPEFNINTFLLAEQFRRDSVRPVDLDSLVYDAINKRTPEEGFRRVDAADYILFLKPGFPPGPDWSRVYAQDYRAYCEKVGILLDAKISPDLDVFKIPKVGVQ